MMRRSSWDREAGADRRRPSPAPRARTKDQRNRRDRGGHPHRCVDGAPASVRAPGIARVSPSRASLVTHRRWRGRPTRHVRRLDVRAYNDGSFTATVQSGVMGPLGWSLIYAYGPGGAELTPGTTPDRGLPERGDFDPRDPCSVLERRRQLRVPLRDRRDVTVHDVAYSGGPVHQAVAELPHHLRAGAVP